MICEVRISRRAQKQLQKVPIFILDKLESWIDAIELDGLESVRKIPGYHDKPLSGKRKGQRSIRLSKAYRAIYIIDNDGNVEFVSIEEVNKHEY